jgi:hypothetical protein
MDRQPIANVMTIIILSEYSDEKQQATKTNEMKENENNENETSQWKTEANESNDNEKQYVVMTNRRRTIIVITTIMARGHAIMAILVKNQ